MGVRGELRMIGTAIRKRWLTDELKPLAIEAIERGLQCGDERAEQTAVRNLLMMEAQNQGDEHKLVDVRIQQEHDRLDAIAAELGVDPDIVADAARTAGLIVGGNASTDPTTTDERSGQRRSTQA